MRENKINTSLSHFARCIVQGEIPSSAFDRHYPHYSLDVAIEVYRNNYRGNLHDALAGAYPVVQQLVGDEFFRFLARQFMERHPPRSANLHEYGVELAEFIRTFEPASTLRYLPDVSTLEWACHCAYFVEDSGTLALDKLALVSQDDYEYLLLPLHAAVQLIPSPFPITVIWQQHQAEMGADFRIDLDSGECIALVSRKQDVVLVNEASEAEALWLRCLGQGLTLGLATRATLEKFPAFNLQGALIKMVTANVFTRFELARHY